MSNEEKKKNVGTPEGKLPQQLNDSELALTPRGDGGEEGGPSAPDIGRSVTPTSLKSKSRADATHAFLPHCHPARADVFELVPRPPSPAAGPYRDPTGDSTRLSRDTSTAAPPSSQGGTDNGGSRQSSWAVAPASFGSPGGKRQRKRLLNFESSSPDHSPPGGSDGRTRSFASPKLMLNPAKHNPQDSSFSPLVAASEELGSPLGAHSHHRTSTILYFAVEMPINPVPELIANFAATIGHMIQVAVEHFGTVHEIRGNSLTITFNVGNREVTDHCALAARAGLVISDFLEETDALGDLTWGIGISTGRMLYGEIGTPEIKSYVLMGEALVQATWLAYLCWQIGAKVLVTDGVNDFIQQQFCRIPVDFVSFETKAAKIRRQRSAVLGASSSASSSEENVEDRVICVFEVRGEIGSESDVDEEVLSYYTSGLAAIRSGEFEEALRQFSCIDETFVQSDPQFSRWQAFASYYAKADRNSLQFDINVPYVRCSHSRWDGFQGDRDPQDFIAAGSLDPLGRSSGRLSLNRTTNSAMGSAVGLGSSVSNNSNLDRIVDAIKQAREKRSNLNNSQSSSGKDNSSGRSPHSPEPGAQQLQSLVSPNTNSEPQGNSPKPRATAPIREEFLPSFNNTSRNLNSVSVQLESVSGAAGPEGKASSPDQHNPTDKEIDIIDIDGKYWRRSDTLLGKGAFGEVWLGMSPADGRLIAMKTLRIPEPPAEQDVAAMPPAERRRRAASKGARKPVDKLQELVDEIRMLTTLKHKNVVSFLGCAVLEDHVVLNMEYVSGGSLQHVLEEFGKIALSAVQRYTKDIIRGLQYLHSQGIVHRDIKPGNVLLHIDGTCKLTDFGTSAKIQQLSGQATVVGTPLYMSPEQARGPSTTTFSSDIWSLGIMIVQLLTGIVPYEITENFSLFQHMHKLAFDAEYQKIKLPDSLPLLARQFVQGCLHPDPAQRSSLDALLLHPFVVMSADRSKKIHATVRAPQTALAFGTDAYLMKPFIEDQRLPNRREPNVEVSAEELQDLGILYWKIDPKEALSPEGSAALERICAEMNYKNRDEVILSPEKLPNYEQWLKTFFEEHCHEDEEVRLIVEGDGFFDFRSLRDEWIRFYVTPGDFIVIPAGIYHRFTLSMTNYIHAFRFFQTVPRWTAIKRPAETHPCRQKYLCRIQRLMSTVAGEVSDQVYLLTHPSHLDAFLGQQSGLMHHQLVLLYLTAAVATATNKPWSAQVVEADRTVGHAVRQLLNSSTYSPHKPYRGKRSAVPSDLVIDGVAIKEQDSEAAVDAEGDPFTAAAAVTNSIGWVFAQCNLGKDEFRNHPHHPYREHPVVQLRQLPTLIGLRVRARESLSPLSTIAEAQKTFQDRQISPTAGSREPSPPTETTSPLKHHWHLDYDVLFRFDGSQIDTSSWLPIWLDALNSSTSTV